MSNVDKQPHKHYYINIQISLYTFKMKIRKQSAGMYLGKYIIITSKIQSASQQETSRDGALGNA